MVPRIEIELTSQRPDGTWTWRAAGARQPKGVVDGSLLPAGAKVADVLRAEAEVDVDGMRVRSVLPPKGRKEAGPRLEVVGPPRTDPPVSTELKAGTPEHKPGRRRDAPPRSRGDRGPERGRDATDRPRRESRAGRPGEAREGRRGEGDARARPPARPGAPTRPPARRLQPGRAHRQAFVASLPPEQRPIAEQLLRGGLAAVRQAVDEQNARARAAGEPEIKADALVALAEELLPGVRAADWRDRAEAAVADPETLSLRDLRTVVAGAGAARDEEARGLATRLREVLDRRSAAERQEWLDQIAASLTEGRVVRALRLSGRPPEPGQRFPADVAASLAEAASKAMTPTSSAERWLAVLEAVTVSPVRRAVRPEGLPAGADAAFLEAAAAAREKVPAVGALLPEVMGRKATTGPAPRRARSAPPPMRPKRGEDPRPSSDPVPGVEAEAVEAPTEAEVTPVEPPAEEVPGPGGPPSEAQAEPVESQTGHTTAEDGGGDSPAAQLAAPAAEGVLGDHGEDAVGVEELGETVHQG